MLSTSKSPAFKMLLKVTTRNFEVFSLMKGSGVVEKKNNMAGNGNIHVKYLKFDFYFITSLIFTAIEYQPKYKF